jgi:hypothetical protein
MWRQLVPTAFRSSNSLPSSVIPSCGRGFQSLFSVSVQSRSFSTEENAVEAGSTPEAETKPAGRQPTGREEADWQQLAKAVPKNPSPLSHLSYEMPRRVTLDVRELLYRLHVEDPKVNTAGALAKLYKLSEARVAAILRLEGLAASSEESAFPVVEEVLAEYWDNRRVTKEPLTLQQDGTQAEAPPAFVAIPEEVEAPILYKHYQGNKSHSQMQDRRKTVAAIRKSNSKQSVKEYETARGTFRFQFQE